jgi:DGQHR domain-containing protein
MNNNTVKIKINEVKQPIDEMYIGKIEGTLLYKMSKVDIRRIGEKGNYCGMQRELDTKKVRSVKKYINSFDASFPNSIILNLNKKYLISKTSEYIEIEKTEDAFTIIDGQHRLSGFEDYANKSFELVVSMFIDLDINSQANIFKTINSEQKKVDQSLTFDLEEYDIYETPRKFARSIAIMFNSDSASPWYKRIKMIGKKDEISTNASISSKAFIEPILDFIYDDRDYYDIRNQFNYNKSVNNRKYIFNYNEYDKEKYIFWQLYIDDNKEVLYKILLNYFKALEICMKKEWEKRDSILTKAIGYYAIMYLFKDIYEIAIKEGDFTQEKFEIILKPLNQMENINSERFGSSGAFTYNKIYKEMKSILQIE